MRHIQAHGLVPLHMPGHKRNPFLAPDLPFGLDVTEIEGSWDLHHPDAALRARLQDVARERGAAHSFYMTNGSTGGLLSAIHTLCPPETPVLLSRASHQSVYHGVELLRLHPFYLVPSRLASGINGPVAPEDVERALTEHADIRTVIITSPTFEGVVSDVKTIAALCHAHGARLLVDQAHGAHLRYFAPSLDAVAAGADIVVESLHKMLPALTPAALVHASRDVDPVELSRAISIFETSSPSHLILASIDCCLKWLEREGVHAHQESLAHWNEASALWHGEAGLQKIKHVKTDDPFKVVLSTRESDCNGPMLAQMMRTAGYEPEMVHPQSILALLSVADDFAMYPRFVEAIRTIDARLGRSTAPKPLLPPLPPLPRPALPLDVARRAKRIRLSLREARGHVAAETVWTYPPGIPLLLPGEPLDDAMVSHLLQLAKQGIPVRTEADPNGSVAPEVWCVSLEDLTPSL
ncbi:MAG: aminotransferase class V-fold PLP-dependent enzyme [Peptoniphilaceae bacterium]|nr:aminotransferase class V-fold PLP-dependent enzyme [Peptoniphilaceae bacterium]